MGQFGWAVPLGTGGCRQAADFWCGQGWRCTPIQASTFYVRALLPQDPQPFPTLPCAVAALLSLLDYQSSTGQLFFHRTSLQRTAWQPPKHCSGASLRRTSFQRTGGKWGIPIKSWGLGGEGPPESGGSLGAKPPQGQQKINKTQHVMSSAPVGSALEGSLNSMRGAKILAS